MSGGYLSGGYLSGGICPRIKLNRQMLQTSTQKFCGRKDITEICLL